MKLASAYPNSAISTGAMIAIALVMAGSLACWLVMVYVADRQRRNLSVRLAQESAGDLAGADLAGADLAGPDLAGPEDTDEDEEHASTTAASCAESSRPAGNRPARAAA